MVDMIYYPWDDIIAAAKKVADFDCFIQFGPIEEPGAKGCTEFSEGEKPVITISIEIPIMNSLDILTHELAHVICGVDSEDHGEEWQNTYDKIFDAYHEIVMQRYADSEKEDVS